MSLRHKRKTFINTILLLIVTIGLGQACSKVNLNRIDSTQVFSSKGSFCVSVDDFTRYNKILFVIDKSGSNGNNDPNDIRRGDNIQRFLDQFRADQYYRWGLISFNGDEANSYIIDPVSGSPAFGDSNQMQTAINTYRNDPDNGQTPYLTALGIAKQTIEADMITNPQEDSVYNIFFMSDGRPTDGPTDYVQNSPTDPYVRAVRDIISIAPNRIFLSTAFYTPGAADTVIEALGLRYLAEAGGGSFTNMENNDTIDFDEVRVGIRKKAMVIKRMGIVNLNSGFCLDGTVGVDSDADGLCDKDEIWINENYQNALEGQQLDPRNRNSIHAAYSDKFVYKFQLLPTGDRLGNCTFGVDDEDFDLVNPCEEMMLNDNNANGPTPQWTEQMRNASGGTADKTNPDSDGDGFLDGLEFYQFGIRASAVNYLNILERFSGGITGEDLMTEHRHPRFPERFDANSYDASLLYAGVNMEGENCYNFNQSQLALYPTLEVPDTSTPIERLRHGAGENVVLMYYIAVPEDDPNSKGYLFHSYQKVPYTEKSGILGLKYDQYEMYKIPNFPAIN